MDQNNEKLKYLTEPFFRNIIFKNFTIIWDFTALWEINSKEIKIDLNKIDQT